MKNHMITVDGVRYYTAQVVDADTNITHDQTVIFAEKSVDYPPEIVDYYFGAPDLQTTVQYVTAYRRRSASSDLKAFCERLIRLMEHEYSTSTVAYRLSTKLKSCGIDDLTAFELAQTLANLLTKKD